MNTVKTSIIGILFALSVCNSFASEWAFGKRYDYYESAWHLMSDSLGTEGWEIVSKELFLNLNPCSKTYGFL